MSSGITPETYLFANNFCGIKFFIDDKINFNDKERLQKTIIFLGGVRYFRKLSANSEYSA